VWHDIFEGTVFVLPYLALAGIVALMVATLSGTGVVGTSVIVGLLWVRRSWLAAAASGLGVTAGILGILLT
jgi:hypothetical protein